MRGHGRGRCVGRKKDSPPLGSRGGGQLEFELEAGSWGRPSDQGFIFKFEVLRRGRAVQQGGLSDVLLKLYRVAETQARASSFTRIGLCQARMDFHNF